MKARKLVARVELIEEQVEPGQPLVNVLGGAALRVVVVPERAHRLLDVTIGRVSAGEAGQDVGIVLVIVERGGEVPVGKGVTGEAVTFRRSVGVVEVRRGLPPSESATKG